MDLSRILFLLVVFLPASTIQAQPGWSSEPLFLWIKDSEDIINLACDARFKVSAEFYSENDAANESKELFVESLSCKYDTIKHIYYDYNTKTSRLSQTETIPMYFHSGTGAKGSYLVQSINIIRNKKERMKLNVWQYVLKDNIYYSGGNGVDIPTVIYFKEGEYDITDAQQFDETQHIKEKYKQSTFKYHQLPAEQVIVEVASVPEWRNEQLSIGTGFIAVRVGTTFQTPVGNALVKAHFEDGTITDLKYDKNEKNFSVYLYVADPLSPHAPVRIKKISVSADNYFSEEFVPHQTVNTLTLFLRSERFIYHTGFEKLPMHMDNRYLCIYFPEDIKIDTTGFSKKLNELELMADTTFSYCGPKGNRKNNAMLLKKKNGGMFEDDNCQELGFLRNSFKDIYISPKLYMRTSGDNGNEKRFFYPINNKVKVMYHHHQPEMIKLFEEMALPYIHHSTEREYELTLPVTNGIKGMNHFTDQLKTSGLFIGVEHQYYSIKCY